MQFVEKLSKPVGKIIDKLDKKVCAIYCVLVFINCSVLLKTEG